MPLASQHEIFQPLAMRKGRVLIVDDELSIRMPIRRNLLQAGLEVIEATDGEQAIAALREGDNALMVDAVLCDIRMPNVNGIDLIPYLRAQYPSIPIIVLTGYPAMFSFALGVETVTCQRDWALSDHEMYLTLVKKAIEWGVMPDHDPREPWFLCYSHSDADVDQTLNVYAEIVKEVKR